LNTQANWFNYFYFDPFHFFPIYVGATHSSSRPFVHLQLAQSKRSTKSDFILRPRAGLSMGFEPPIVVVSGKVAHEALDTEAAFIVALGCRYNGTGLLYNKNRGWAQSHRPVVTRRPPLAVLPDASTAWL
jgi:hypothetical protein